MKYIAFLILLSIGLVGCSSTYTYKPYGQFVSKDGMVDKSISNYVQWNNEYAVTVKHSEFRGLIEYNSQDYDVRFVKIKSSEIPVWTNPNKGDLLSMTGFPRAHQKQPTVREGNDIGNIIIKEKKGYRAVKTLIVQGMSGGPVFNTKNEVVGINIGYSSEQVFIDGQQTELSIYLPYNIILAEWNKFQSKE